MFERRARAFVVLLSEGAFEAAHARLTGPASAIASVAALEDSWRRVVDIAGPLESVVDSEYQGSRGGVVTVTVEALLARARTTLQVTLTRDGVRGYQVTAQEGYDWTPPAYADPSAFTETTVTLEAPGACTLGGTLSLPADGREHPGVVIVHGSGPLDRDGTFGPNKPYKELAWGLATAGVAVLRYDKRTAACEVALADVTVDDVTTEDAVTAVERLREHPAVADDEVAVVGHSLGGALTPRIARRDGDLAGGVMLAPGPARPVAEAVLDQQRHLIEQRDLTAREREAALERARSRAERIRTLDIADDEVLLGLGGREYFRSLAAYDGPETAAGLDLPLFVGQGTRDYQVTPDGDFPRWEAALAGRSDVRLELYEGLNHLFQAGRGPSTPAEYFAPEAVLAGRVVEDVVGFLEGRV